MSVITVSREYGSGGSEVARRVATLLDWRLIDNDFIKQVAERAGMSAEEVAQHEERVPSFAERLGRLMAVSSPEVFVAAEQATADLPNTEDEIHRTTQAVIAEAVQHGHVVLVGRGAQAYVGDDDSAVHVFVAADRRQRIKRAMERGFDEREAEQRVDEIDEQRKKYVKARYGREWKAPANYHIMINSGAMSLDDAAELIVHVAKRRGLA